MLRCRAVGENPVSACARRANLKLKTYKLKAPLPQLLFSNAQSKGGRSDLELFFKGHGEMRGGGESGFAGYAFYRAAGIFDDEAFGVFQPEAQDMPVRGLSAVLEKKTREMTKGHASQGFQLTSIQLVGEVVLNE
jgi:hypothetical protein